MGLGAFFIVWFFAAFSASGFAHAADAHIDANDLSSPDWEWIQTRLSGEANAEIESPICQNFSETSRIECKTSVLILNQEGEPLAKATGAAWSDSSLEESEHVSRKSIDRALDAARIQIKIYLLDRRDASSPTQRFLKRTEDSEIDPIFGSIGDSAILWPRNLETTLVKTQTLPAILPESSAESL